MMAITILPLLLIRPKNSVSTGVIVCHSWSNANLLRNFVSNFRAIWPTRLAAVHQCQLYVSTYFTTRVLQWETYSISGRCKVPPAHFVHQGMIFCLHPTAVRIIVDKTIRELNRISFVTVWLWLRWTLHEQQKSVVSNLRWSKANHETILWV